MPTLTIEENNIFEQCQYLPEEQNILNRLDRDLRQLGFSGSTKIPKLIFLCLKTRYLNKPVSAVIKGPSGSGKSFALSSALKFIPTSAYEMFNGMSERALIYMQGLDLRHKHLVIQEAAGLADGQGRVFLRQLLSEGQVRYATVQSTRDGLVGTELPTLQGPMGLLMTTTANALHPEDETRLFSVQIEQSPDRIREALIEQARGQRRTASQVDFAPWHALHEFIGSNVSEVTIPFADRIAQSIPVSDHRVLRDFPQVLSLIEAHALMHQFSRGTDNEGRIIATLDDYAAVYDLVHEQLAQGLERAVPEHIRVLVSTVQDMLTHCNGGQYRGFAPPVSDGPTSLSITQTAERLQINQGNVSRNVQQAVDQGFLENVNPGQGRMASIILGNRELPNGTALPSPEELRVALSA